MIPIPRSERVRYTQSTGGVSSTPFCTLYFRSPKSQMMFWGIKTLRPLDFWGDFPEIPHLNATDARWQGNEACSYHHPARDEDCRPCLCFWIARTNFGFFPPQKSGCWPPVVRCQLKGNAQCFPHLEIFTIEIGKSDLWPLFHEFRKQKKTSLGITVVSGELSYDGGVQPWGFSDGFPWKRISAQSQPAILSIDSSIGLLVYSSIYPLCPAIYQSAYQHICLSMQPIYLSMYLFVGLSRTGERFQRKWEKGTNLSPSSVTFRWTDPWSVLFTSPFPPTVDSMFKMRFTFHITTVGLCHVLYEAFEHHPEGVWHDYHCIIHLFCLLKGMFFSFSKAQLNGLVFEVCYHLPLLLLWPLWHATTSAGGEEQFI